MGQNNLKEDLELTLKIENHINSKGWSSDIRQEAIDIIASEEIPDDSELTLYLKRRPMRSVTYIKRGEHYLITTTTNIPL